MNAMQFFFHTACRNQMHVELFFPAKPNRSGDRSPSQACHRNIVEPMARNSAKLVVHFEELSRGTCAERSFEFTHPTQLRLMICGRRCARIHFLSLFFPSRSFCMQSRRRLLVFVASLCSSTSRSLFLLFPHSFTAFGLFL